MKISYTLVALVIATFSASAHAATDACGQPLNKGAYVGVPGGNHVGTVVQLFDGNIVQLLLPGYLKPTILVNGDQCYKRVSQGDVRERGAYDNTRKQLVSLPIDDPIRSESLEAGAGRSVL
jgi:hypothetical protein